MPLVIWLSEFFLVHWPYSLILLGLFCLVYCIFDMEPAVGVFSLIFYAGPGVLFLFVPASDVWSWLVQFEAIAWMVEGRWFEVAIKITGAIAAIGMLFRLGIGILSE